MEGRKRRDNVRGVGRDYGEMIRYGKGRGRDTILSLCCASIPLVQAYQSVVLITRVHESDSQQYFPARHTRRPPKSSS